MSINFDKSKSMSTSAPPPPLTLQCSDKSVEQVQEFKYLGSWIENTGDVTFEIKRRIGQASGAFNRLTPIWRCNRYSLRLKLRLFNSNVLSILMYASECWKLNQQLEKRIFGIENICLRMILKISWHQKITNREIRLKTNQPIVTEVLKKRRWTYLGHVLRMPEDRLPSRVYQWHPEGRRRRGRPKHTLRRQYDWDLKRQTFPSLRNGKISLQLRSFVMNGETLSTPYAPPMAQEDLRSNLRPYPPSLLDLRSKVT